MPRKSKTVPVALGILVFGVAAIFALSQPKSSQIKTNNTPSIPASSPVVSSPTAGGQVNSGGYTLAEVSTHSDATSCWTAINSSVYDLTSWIARHPGGEGTILSICGKDGSAAFNNQHGGQSRPENILSGFKIGALK